MFNGKKIKELERRIELLEEGLGTYLLYPGDNLESLNPHKVEIILDVVDLNKTLVPVRTAIQNILDHLKLEYETTPATTQLVVKK